MTIVKLKVPGNVQKVQRSDGLWAIENAYAGTSDFFSRKSPYRDLVKKKNAARRPEKKRAPNVQ